MGTCLRVPYTWNMVIHVTHVLKMFFKNLYCMNINKVHFFTCFKCWYFYFLTTHTHFNQEPGISAICNCAYHHMKIFQQNSKWKTLRYGQYRQGLFFLEIPANFEVPEKSWTQDLPGFLEIVHFWKEKRMLLSGRTLYSILTRGMKS